MRKEDKKLQKHLVDEMMKVSETNPDVMLYMQALMENYEKLEQENKQLKETLKDIEELLLGEEQPVQPCNIRYDILEIIKKALGDKE